MVRAHAIRPAAALGGELSESQASLRVFLTAGGLAILGLSLLLFTIWWWRGTRPEPPALGPLEVMSDRRWDKASDGERRRLVDETRPAGAFGLNGAPAPVPIDLSVLARDLPSGFDDLRDDPDRASDAPSELAPLPFAPGPEPFEPPDDVDATVFRSSDDTTFQSPSHGGSPSIAVLLHDGHPLEQHADEQFDEPSDEMVIDPLLQRTAAQE